MQLHPHCCCWVQADPNARLEARTWLVTTVSNIYNVAADVRTDCFLPQRHSSAGLLSATNVSPLAWMQLLLLLCELHAADMGQLLAGFPQLVRDFFSCSDSNITSWFAHFSMSGISDFKYGAKALANYALSNRSSVWQYLVWTGKHTQAPVAVASKTHYFCELDVVATVRQLLNYCPDFWESEELTACLQSGEWLALDYQHFAEVSLDTVTHF